MLKLLKPYICSRIAFKFSYLSLSTTNTNRFNHFTKQNLILLSSNNTLPLNDKILIYITLKNQYHFITPNLHKNIIFSIQLSKDQQPLLGIFLSSYQDLSIQCLKYYIDYYSNINAPVFEELALAKYLLTIKTYRIRDEVDLWIVQTAKLKNKENLTRLFLSSSFTISQFLQFFRMFYRQIDTHIFASYLQTRYEEPETNEEKILLVYICKLLEINFNKYSLVNVTQGEQSAIQTKDPKIVCMLIQLINADYPSLTSKLINSIEFDQTWNYESIIWISQHLNNEPLEKAHQRLLNTTLTDITTLTLYIKRIPFSSHSQKMYNQLSTWLSEQLKLIDPLQCWRSSDLLELIEDLPENKFQNYFLFLAKHCKGRLNWQQTTQLYYYCRKYHIESQDVDALRIYVVNGYTSMGTARTRIPTTSYYYKLIEIVPAKQLYRYQIPFE